MSEPESLVEITPSQIIGEDAYMHLVFEGYEVVDAAELSTLRSRCETAERALAFTESELEAVLAARDEAVAALQSLCDGDAAYFDNEIRIRCADHGDAIKVMRLAREALAKAEKAG